MSHASPVDRLEPGDHVCWTFEDDAARDAVLAAFVRAALPVGDKVIYVTHALRPPEVVDTLTRAGIDAAHLVQTRRLEVYEARGAYLATGRFDAERLIAGFVDTCARARADGYAGLRVAGDMSWTADEGVDAVDLGRYEAAVNDVYVDGYAIGLCLYDARLFPRSRLAALSAVHPAAAGGAADATWSPLLRIRRCLRSGRLRLEGEADLSNRGSLVAVLDALPTRVAARPAVLDVAGLRFADVATAHSIVVAAARLGALRVVGADARLRWLLDFVGGHRTPGLVVDTYGAAEATA